MNLKQILVESSHDFIEIGNLRVVLQLVRPIRMTQIESLLLVVFDILLI